MLAELLGEMPVQRFLDDYYQKLPFATVGGCTADVLQLTGWQMLAELLTHRDLDLLIVRRGQPTDQSIPRSVADAQRLVAEGYTLVIRHAERLSQSLGRVAAKWQADLAGDVDVHLYCTPGDSFGFGWHYDAEEVFTLQTAGIKDYQLRKNTVQPWPVVETLPSDMRYSAEISPLLRCRLVAGDWLYIPSGYWHKATAAEDSFSIAIGVLPTTGVDVFDALRPEILDSLRWRQRLPVLGDAATTKDEDLLATLRAMFQDFADDLMRILRDENQLRRFLRQAWTKNGYTKRLPQDDMGHHLNAGQPIRTSSLVKLEGSD